jgi:Protein of unknown function (DUF2786)
MSDAVLDKVRKLLAKAEDPACTPEEAAAFNDKAAELIAKYGVDRALLAARDPTTDTIGDRVVEVVPPYAQDKVGLLVGVASALRCRSVRRAGQGHRGFSVHLFGFGSDLERVELLFTSLLVQAAYGLAAAVPDRFENLAAYRRSWLVGFSRAVSYRLREAEQRATSAATGTGDERVSGGSMALVLADRSDQVARRVDEVYPYLVSVGPRRLTGSGLGAGLDAGRRADLGGGRVPSGRRATALGR